MSDAICKSTPGRIRTCDLLIRSQLLYPAELRGRVEEGCGFGEGIIPLGEKDVKRMPQVRDGAAFASAAGASAVR